MKAGVHTAALLIAGLCATYNAAAWLKRRQPHLAVNAVIYMTTFWWERCHVVRHLAACTRAEAAPADSPEQRLSEAA